MTQPEVRDLQPAARSPLALRGYVIGIFAVSIVLLVLVCVQQLGEVPWGGRDLAACYVFAAFLIAAELRPLLVVRGDGGADRVTISTTFAVVLVMIGPICFAMLAQALAVVVDDVWRRRGPLQVMFNVGQYLLTLGAARAVFALASGRGYFDATVTPQPADLVPALLCGAVYFAVNNLAVAGVVAIDQGLSVVAVLREDLRVQSLTSSILIGLAPVAAVVSQFSLFMVPLLILPLAGVQHNAWMASRRQHEALHDGLTGLANRALFRRLTEQAISRRGRAGPRIAVMLIDLDHFKEVNDTLGHHVGDDLLREVARRVVGALPDDVTLARLGGDEFAVLVPEYGDAQALMLLAQRVSARLAEPVLAAGVRLSVQASIGVALCPEHGDTVDVLVQRADVALYRAKEKRGEVQVYAAETDLHSVRRLGLLGDLHAAVDNGELVVHYQPQVEAASGRVVALEALVRWQHPSHGLLLPDAFIPLAESNGLIDEISRQVLLAGLTARSELASAGHALAMSVNISARLLSDQALPQWVESILAATATAAELLTVEVTETTLIADPRRAVLVLKPLRELGVRLSIDDFGTGYSSLSYLRRIRPDEIKIDRSFVRQMQADEDSAVIVRSTVGLAHGLGMSVVAEGVEDTATFEALAALGCERIQGHLLARPMSPDRLRPWLDRLGAAGWSGETSHDEPGIDVMPTSPTLPTSLGLPAPRGRRANR